MTSQNRAPDYGIDAPGLVRGFALGGSVALVLAIIVARRLAGTTLWGSALAVALALVTAYLLGMGCYMLYTSKVAKYRTREALLDLIDWRGDEAVLDIGCGRGLMLVGAARRVPRGRAVGIDVWAASDQSANTPAAAIGNAGYEGVADRVEVRTADMRDLPFADAMFDVIVSHWAVHNLAAAADRNRALAEMVRVLRPGGCILLADIAHRADYAAQLARLGLTDQQPVVASVADAVRRTVSFGSFQPAAILARRGG